MKPYLALTPSALALGALLAAPATAQMPRIRERPTPAAHQPGSGLAKLPVREVTVFKDGHAFLLREGEMSVDSAGDVVLDDLPTPVVGTFWPYQVGGKLRGVVAGQDTVDVPHNALSIYELMKQNIGADVTVFESGQTRFDANILDLPQPAGGAGETDGSGSIVLLSTKDGVRVRSVNSIQEIIFKEAPKQSSTRQELASRLRLQLDGPKRPAGEKVGVGMVYLQKGIRWIPGYRMSLDGAGHASLKLQATLANELVDLQNTDVNLVVGVPSFSFKDSVDPISLSNTFAQLSSLFDPASRSASGFSNAIMSQAISNGYNMSVRSRPQDTGGDTNDANLAVQSGEKNEDYFVFTAKNISLAKGERTVFPLAQYELPYEDVYTVQAAAKPPAQLYRNYNVDQQVALTKSFAAPTVMHQIRLTNNSKDPLTTAPLLIDSRGRLIAQSLMTYTATGGSSDLELAPAVDITVKRRESEVKRTPNALRIENSDSYYTRIDVAGRVTITSYRNVPVALEMTQQFLGTVDKAENGNTAGPAPTVRKLGMADDDSSGADSLPSWWNSSQGDWGGVNGLSKAKWTLTIPQKGTVEIPFNYHYYWR